MALQKAIFNIFQDAKLFYSDLLTFYKKSIESKRNILPKQAPMVNKKLDRYTVAIRTAEASQVEKPSLHVPGAPQYK